MSPPSFDNIINKFKSSTKQAADQMGKATKIARIKMDIMTLAGERTRYCQTIGERVYALFSESAGLAEAVLRERVRHEFTQIERIDGRVRDLENQIADLQAMVQDTDVAEATNVTEVTEHGEPTQSSGSSPVD